MRWYSVLLGLLFTLNAIAETKPAPPLECGDFLKQLGLQRPEIKYISCTRTNSHEPGMDGLTATYQVAGKDIAKVETWLIRFAHAKPLKFNCCGWETNDVTFKGKDDAQYTIGMGGETTESSRKNFSKIPYLTLYVSHYFYEP